MLELSGTRKDMFARIGGSADATEARIFTKPSKAIFFHLLQKTKVSRIYMTRGIFATVSTKLLGALKASGISVEILENKVGRPAKFEHDKKLDAIRMLKEGKTAAKISNLLGVPTTSIYAWKRRMAKKEVRLPDST